eukprot:SAG11_NODE_8042_length_1065_cov_2.369565_1_plen_111_part_00
MGKGGAGAGADRLTKLIQKEQWSDLKKAIANDGCSTVDKAGRLPLHLCLWKQAPNDVVDAVFKKNPDAAMQVSLGDTAGRWLRGERWSQRRDMWPTLSESHSQHRAIYSL